MLAIILSTVFARTTVPNWGQYQFGRKHRGADQFLDAARIAKKAESRDAARADMEKLRAEAEATQAKLMAAEGELKRKEERLQLLSVYSAQYAELKQKIAENDAIDADLQAKMQILLSEILKLNGTEVQVVQQEVQEAKTDMMEKAAEVQAVTGQSLPTQEVLVTAPQESAPMMVEKAPPFAPEISQASAPTAVVETPATAAAPELASSSPVENVASAAMTTEPAATPLVSAAGTNTEAPTTPTPPETVPTTTNQAPVEAAPASIS
jgi:dTMP kinase